MIGKIAVSPMPVTGTRKYSSFVIEPKSGLLDLNLSEIWQYRELLFFLGWRDLSVLYKQTMIGVAWVVLQPLVTMVVFSIIFGNFARMPSDGLPYPVFVYTALLPWNMFSKTLSRSATSLVANANLISKVYFPRLIIPLASIAVPLADFLISSVILLVMLVWFDIQFTWAMLTLPLFASLSVLVALSVGLWLAALNVRYRDVGHTIPFIIQVWMYASPVVYSVSLIPERWQLLYSLNPMTGVIEGFRWALLGRSMPNMSMLIISTVATLFIFVGGLIYFKRVEDVFADIV